MRGRVGPVEYAEGSTGERALIALGAGFNPILTGALASGPSTPLLHQWLRARAHEKGTNELRVSGGELRVNSYAGGALSFALDARRSTPLRHFAELLSASS
jgi:hypothetical protein